MRRLLLFVVTALALAGCSGSKFDPAAGPKPAPPPAAEPSAPAAFTLGTVDVEAAYAPADAPADAPAELPGPARSGVQGVLDRYLNAAVIAPLRSGRPVGDLSAIFAGPALERMNGADRAALVDEGLPRAAQVRVTQAAADLTALIGPDGVAVVAAAITLTVTGAVDGSPLNVQRTGELALTADGENWRITGYNVRVSRDAAGTITTTTVRR